MKRKNRWHLILCLGLWLTICFSVFAYAGIELNSKPLTLTLVANDNKLGDLGHSFLIVRNNTGKSVSMGAYSLPSGEQATIGLRGGTPWITGMGGSYINVEAFQADVYKNFRYVTCAITQSQLSWIISYFSEKSIYYTDAKFLAYNCTTTASYAWDQVCPARDKVIVDNYPKDLKLQIALLRKSKKGTSLTGCGLLSKKAEAQKVFFISKSGLLYPMCISEGLPSNVKATPGKNKISFTWSKLRTVKNKYLKKSYANGYLLRYRKSGDSSYQYKFISGITSTRASVTGLKAYTSYQYELWPCGKYTVDGKTCYIPSMSGNKSGTVRTKASISVSPSKKTIYAGDVFTITPTVQGSSNTIKWTSSNSNVASVSSGKVTGKQAGTATIVARANGVSASCRVTVKKRAYIKISPTSRTIYPKDTFTIAVTYNKRSRKVTWSSSHPDVASVDASGKVTGKKKGTTVITAAVPGGSARCNVTVQNRSSGGGCVTPDTLITLADGSCKRVDQLKDTDRIKAYDFDRGAVTDAPITLFHRVKEKARILRVEFADGTSVGVVKDHCFFDLTARRYVRIESTDQLAQLSGHSFAMLKDGHISGVLLTDIRLEGTTDSYYAPVSEVYLNCFANGLLNMPGYVEGFCNVFELEDNALKYDAAKKAAAIKAAETNIAKITAAKSGAAGIKAADIMNAGAFAVLKNMKIFRKNRLDWLSVSVAKGLISVKELYEVYEFCLPFFT